MTTFADILQQLEALSARTITLDDLPIGDLRKKLFDGGEPLDLSTMALDATVGKSMLATSALNAFLKLAVAADIKLAFGSSSVTFTASPTSAQVTIPHGMGSTPTLVAGFARTPTSARVTVQESAAPSATNIFLTGFISDAVASSLTQNIYWLALG